MKNRIDALRDKMHELGLDGFLVSNTYNIFYLSGFKGLSPEEREAWMLITKNNVYFFTDGRYEEEVNKSIKSETQLRILTGEKNLPTHIEEIAKQESLKTIGFESEDLTYGEYSRIAKHVSLSPSSSVCINIRAIKDSDEIANIKKACEATSKCLTAIVKLIKPGISEFEIAFKIEQYLQNKRLDLAFYPIVAINQNAALPHYDTKSNGSTKVTNQSVVLIDFGARYNNYLSDITRMVFVGKPSDTLRNAYNALLDTQEKTIEQLSYETTPQKIDAFCRDLLIKSGYPSFPHSTGHGVGLEIHEYPKISRSSTDILQKGQVLTIEPGIYVPNSYGMRIEDTVLLKEDKTPEILTTFSKDMLVV